MTDKELYEKCIEAGKNARKWKNRFVAMLPEVARRGLHRKHGFATIVEFAAKVGGVGKATVDAIFRVEKYVSDKPVLKELIAEVGVAKVRVVASIATPENQRDLAKKVKTMSKAALEMYARMKREPEKPIPGSRRTNVSFGLDEDVEFKLRKFKNDMGGDKIEWNDVIKALLEKVARCTRHTNQARHVKKKITRHVPVAIKQSLPEKCQFPSCNKPAEVTHHPHRFSLRANHNNLKPLCKAHHELVHNGEEPPEWRPKTIPFIEQKFAMARRL